MLLLEEKLQSRQNITSSQASKALYLFLSGRVVLTASMAKTLRNIVNGNTSRLTIVNDISATNISLVKKGWTPFREIEAFEMIIATDWVRKMKAKFEHSIF